MSLQFPFLDATQFHDRGDIFQALEDGDYASVLSGSPAKALFQNASGSGGDKSEGASRWRASIYENVTRLASDDQSALDLFLIGLASFQAFLQSNVTGPPLKFKSAAICFPQSEDDKDTIRQTRDDLISALTVDGEAIYGLTPHVELFYLAKALLNHDNVVSAAPSSVWARLRVNFWHQKMLGDTVPSLQDIIYKDLTSLEQSVLGSTSSHSVTLKALFLLERAAIHTFFGADEKARADLREASRLRQFQYVLTGRLGKRTKFQQKDLSQLVVLAKSHDIQDNTSIQHAQRSENLSKAQNGTSPATHAPKAIDLDDDTLLNRVSFTASEGATDDPKKGVPEDLANLDPAAQPILDPIDATILLSFASSITNTSPDHGLTREETLPYAARVIDGGSSNWQVYTQGLLVRSRIETHKARTVERGVLQLQAVVDQIIAETSEDGNESGVTTFLPRATDSESAPVSQRLRYINQLSTPPRWALEAELASRWASLGGLRTAQEIFERLEMWADASLCLAATDEEGKAVRMVRRQLYQSTQTSNGADEEDFKGPEKAKLPVDAPRLFCILGDIEGNPDYYARAWEVSNHRYARAQQLLGKYYLRKNEFEQADEAYSKSLVINPQNHAIWFSLGCVRLETREWRRAVEAFQRCVYIEPENAEAWSNLAAALLHLSPEESLVENGAGADIPLDDDDAEAAARTPDRQKHAREAFVAFKRAAKLKHDSYRIWQNVLNVGATLVPPPFTDIIVAQTHLIDLRAKTEGEGCVDVEVLEGILQHIVATAPPSTANATEPGPRPVKRGLERMFADLMHKKVVPLITHSRRLWQLVAKLATFENRPAAALDAYEKAWRATLNQPGWDDGSSTSTSAAKKAWDEVQDATDELVDGYESLGEKEVTEGLSAGSGALVCANWKFKARTAIRGVIGRRTKAGFEDMDRLRARMEDLK